MDGNIVELDEGTRAKNRAFQERLDDIWRSTDGWEGRLRKEAQDAIDSINTMRDDYQKHINNFTNSLKNEINTIFDKFDKELIIREEKRIEVIEADVDVFFKEVVPLRIEQQSGEVSRQLKRQYETFDIEKKKELKRETKLVQKASKHLQSTAQRFEDEDALQSSCFYTLEDDVVEHERHAARMHLIRNNAAIDHIVVLNKISTTEATVRQEEDVDCLDTVIETQGLLQQTVRRYYYVCSLIYDLRGDCQVLLHFGTKTFEDDENVGSGGEFPVMERLNKRMNRIHDKASAAADSKEEQEEGTEGATTDGLTVNAQ